MRNPSQVVDRSAKPPAGNTTPCCSKIGLKRGPWTPDEDELLSKYIKKEGEGNWRTLPKRAGLLRCGKSCRLRWMNYLRPSVKRGQIAPDEEDLILRLHRLLGNRWSLIAGRIPGRTDNEIKNYWNTHLSKKLISQGIDPRTHKPLNQQQQQQVSAMYGKSASSRARAKNPLNIDRNSNVTPDAVTDNTTSENPSTASQVINTPNSSIQEHLQEGKKSERPAKLPVTYAGTSLVNYGDPASDEVEATMAERSNSLEEDHYPLKVNAGDNNEEDINNYCSDDIFSSFLNSLINEDAFSGQQQQNHPQLNGLAIVPCSDPLVASTYGLSIGWDSCAAPQVQPNTCDDNKRMSE